MATKPIIYQVFPRLLTNDTTHCVPNGTIKQNGSGKMNRFTPLLLRRLKDLGATHVWYTGIIEHASKTRYDGIAPCNPHVVKGNAGSPYAIRDYYDIDPDIAENVDERQQEWDALVERTHAAGLKVIIDFVPNHVAREYGSDAKPDDATDLGSNDNNTVHFAPGNNFYYFPGEAFAPGIDLGHGDGRYVERPAKATGNDCFHPHPSQNDWYETVKLNYGVDYSTGQCHFSPTPRTWHQMLHILLYWSSRGVDGFRCDMAHMVPVEFWHWAIGRVKQLYPHIIFIAELYDVGLYRRYIFDGLFDYLYDKVSLYDTLNAIMLNDAPASALTGCWQAVEGVGQHILHFLENHDEVRLASRQSVGDALKAFPAVVVSATFSTSPFMIYSGQELGEDAHEAEGFSGLDGKTTIFDYWSVPTLRRWHNGGKCDTTRLTAQERALRKTYKRLLRLCNSEAAIARGGFFDLMYVNYANLNAHRVFAFLRHHKSSVLLIAANFGDDTETARLCIPQAAIDACQIAPGDYNATELLTQRGTTLHFGTQKPCIITLEPHSAAIIKIAG